MSLLLRLAAGALALPLIGDEEADKLQTYNDLLENRSRNQGLNRCVAWTATVKRVDRMKRRDAAPRVRGHAEACPSARPDGARVVDGDDLVKGNGEGPAERIKPQTSDPLLFPEQSIG
ncbi:MAG: hypothetical protein DME43_08555 [Verrucomicrobia bacterium]|nr:MAG: hypothetical protein DME43_08555 [Verrucomicrobiota bacterium]